MMKPIILNMVLFYIWWLFINGIIFYAESKFILSILSCKQKNFSIFYIILNEALIFLSIYFETYSLLRELMHISIMILCSAAVLKCTWVKMLTPAMILFSLSSIMDGISAISMGWLAATTTQPLWGGIAQMGISVLLALLFYAVLRFCASRYGFTAQEEISPYLYILLLPCVFVVWVTRFGLGLDNNTLDLASAPFTRIAPYWGFVLIAGALATFFVIMEVFSKIFTLLNLATEKVLLNDQLREQRLYLAEAQKRDDQYRAFQHDINNHLLILSGLIQEEKYALAQEYFDKLHKVSDALLFHISSGNAVLDVLINEKIRYAQQNNIEVEHVIQLPSELAIDDLDLCIVFANILDNAIQACLVLDEHKRKICLTAKVKRQFLLIEMTNPAKPAAAVKHGTGLNNIKHITQKYQGTVEIEQENGFFRISLLLCRICNETPPFTKPG